MRAAAIDNTATCNSSRQINKLVRLPLVLLREQSLRCMIDELSAKSVLQ